MSELDPGLKRPQMPDLGQYLGPPIKLESPEIPGLQLVPIQEYMMPELGMAGTLMGIGEHLDTLTAVSRLYGERQEKLQARIARDFETKTGVTGRFQLEGVVLRKEGETEEESWARLTDGLIAPVAIEVARQTLRVAGKRSEDLRFMVIGSTAGAPLGERVKEEVGLVNVSSDCIREPANSCPTGTISLIEAAELAEMHGLDHQDGLFLFPEVLPVKGLDSLLFSNLVFGAYISWDRQFKVGEWAINVYPQHSDALRVYTFYKRPEGWDPDQVIEMTERGRRTHYSASDDGKFHNMDGEEVTKWAITDVPRDIWDFAQRYNVDLSSATIIAHFANKHIVSAIGDNLTQRLRDYHGNDEAQAHVPAYLQRVGNGSAATTFTTFFEALRRGEIRCREDGSAEVLFVSYGGGLTVSLAKVQLSTSALPTPGVC